jgi:lauroyl/myristoyl acyltransferase
MRGGSGPASEGRQSGWLLGPWGYVLNRAAAPLVPFSLAQRVAMPWGDLAYTYWKRPRDAALRNYARVLGLPPEDRAVQRAARDCFRHFALYIAEMLHVQGWDTNTVLDRLEIEGGEQFKDAEAHGKGIIFVSAHMGSAEIAASVAVLRGYRIAAVTERLHPPFVMDWAVACRVAMGITLLPVERAGISLLRTLRRKEMVAFVIDADIRRGGGLPVTFFARETIFPEGPARLARLSGAPIVFAIAARLPGGRFRAHIEPPLLADRSLSPEADARCLTQRLASAFEGYVRRYPGQWYAFREMWREGSTARITRSNILA